MSRTKKLLRAKWLLLTLSLAAGLVVVSAPALTPVPGHAVQAPRMSLDMVNAGNSYDQNANSMAVGTIENCSTSAAPGNNAQHNHLVGLIIQDIEDLIGWQARFNYDGGRMRLSTANFMPYSDASRGQNVAFPNLPIDPATGVHRDILPASQIPPPAAGPQTAAIGSVYIGPQSAPVSPDTPAKAPPDEASYSAPSGGILATLVLQVLPGQAGQASLSMDLDDGNPNAPGSGVAVFDGTASREVNLDESALFDGFHAEGVACAPPPGIPPVQGEDPGFAEGAPPPGEGGGTSVPGATTPATSPGNGAGQGSASPGQSRTASPTPDGETSEDRGDSNDEGNDGDGGTPAWLYVLIAIVVAVVGAGALAAWRYRARLPWLRDRFP